MVKFTVLLFMVILNSYLFTQQNLVWKLIHPVTKKVLHFGEKGSVQEALIAEKILPNPFVGLNEEKFNWIENHTWKVISNFYLADLDVQKHIIIDFPSIDTYGKIKINDVFIGETENAFVHYYFDISNYVKTGINTVSVEFTPPITYQKERMKEVGVTLPAPNDVGKIQVAPYCRKPQYQFGWDWSMRMLTMGFWEPVSVIQFENNTVISHAIKTESVDISKASLKFSLQLALDENKKYFWESQKFGKEEVTVKNKEVQRVIEIENPKLWWPRGQGEQHLYTDNWKLIDESGEIIFEKAVSFGVKKVELLQEKDKWGTSFQLKVNNRYIFCKGADYIPDDIFPSRITDEKLEHQVEEMLNCNFNMIRIWGGGFYPRESFLEACDKGGLMVWQDFMFACAMYPGNEAFLNNVAVEIKQQTRRIASHPSVVLFNGNNEVDVAWKNWGFQSTYKLNEKEERLIELFYQKLFKELIPSIVKENSIIPYEHTSPLSNWGNDEFYKHGTQHYWGVWHGKDPLQDFAIKYGRFNAEYGFQSFPEFATLKSFSTESDWNLSSKVMKHRQKSYVGNQMIAKHSDLLYGKASDFKQFVYFSQLTQAKAVGMAIASHRINSPRCTGTLYWQYNDCWPSISWSSVDYFGRWKALQYQVKKDFEDVAVVETVDSTQHVSYYLVSDTPNGFLSHVNLAIYDSEGKVLDSYRCKLSLLNPGATVLFDKELAFYENQNIVLKFDWDNTQDTKQTRYFTKGHFPNSDKDYQPIIRIVSLDPDSKSGVIEIETSKMLQDCWITSKNGNIHFTSNFNLFLPGKHTIPFTYAGEINTSDFQIYFR